MCSILSGHGVTLTDSCGCGGSLLAIPHLPTNSPIPSPSQIPCCFLDTATFFTGPTLCKGLPIVGKTDEHVREMMSGMNGR